MEAIRVAIITKENSTINFPIRDCLEEKYRELKFIHSGIFKVNNHDNTISKTSHDFILENCDLIIYAPDENNFKERVGFSITLLEKKPVLFAYKKVSDSNVNFYKIHGRQAKASPISSSEDLINFMIENGFEPKGDNWDYDFDDWDDDNHSDEDYLKPEKKEEELDIFYVCNRKSVYNPIDSFSGLKEQFNTNTNSWNGKWAYVDEFDTEEAIKADCIIYLPKENGNCENILYDRDLHIFRDIKVFIQNHVPYSGKLIFHQAYYDKESDSWKKDSSVELENWHEFKTGLRPTVKPKTSSEDTFIDLSKVKIDKHESFLMTGVKIHCELQKWFDEFDDDRRRLLL